MTDFAYPSSAELRVIEQTKLPNLMANRPVFRWCPITEEDAWNLMWDQRDNYTGLQQIRGLNGEPGRVQAIGHKTFVMRPGVYGEFMDIDEEQITARRQIGTFNQPINLDTLVVERQDQLLNRRLDRIEKIIWDLFIAGTFSVASYHEGDGGTVIVQTDSYTTQTFTRAVAWGTVATATPLNDFRQVQLLSRGYSVKFGTEATAVMNRSTLNKMLNNTNNADLYGRRVSGLATANNLGDVQRLLTGDGLPNILVYDDGYIDAAGNFQLFIPTDKVILFGQRPSGARIAEYRMVRNANNPGLAPGAYTKVEDNAVTNSVPRKIKVHDGHNGGPVIYYPSAVVLMNV